MKIKLRATEVKVLGIRNGITIVSKPTKEKFYLSRALPITPGQSTIVPENHLVKINSPYGKHLNEQFYLVATGKS